MTLFTRARAHFMVSITVRSAFARVLSLPHMYEIWEVFYLPPSAFFRCSSTFDGRHSLNRFPFAGSVTQQENETERCDWLERKAPTFCIP